MDGIVEVVARRMFGLPYIIMDSIFIVFFCVMLFVTKRRQTLLFALFGGVLYFLVDYCIFHLLTHSRHIENGNLFWVLVWMSMSYGITNFAWIWLCLRKDERLAEWTLLIFVWWLVCPILDDAFSGDAPQIVIWRETGEYHWFMALFMVVSYMAVIVWNLLRKNPKQRFRILWLFVIGVAVQFGWEFTLLIGGIRSEGMPLTEQIKTLVVNSLMETNLGLPAIYCIYLFFSSRFTEACKRRETPTTFLGRLEESNDGICV